MRQRICALIGSSLFVTLLFGASAVHASLVVNGGFETGDFTGWTVNTVYNPYDVANPAVVLANLTPTGPGDYAYTGTYGAVFSPNTVDEISQTTAVVPAGSYLISFDLEKVYNDDASLNVILDGTRIAQYYFPMSTHYTPYSIPVVVASQGPQTLEFQLAVGSSGPVYMDDICMTSGVAPVPEPSTVISGALLLLPFGWGAFRQCSKKLQAA